MKGRNIKMKFTSNKEKGNSGLAVAIGYYGTQGYTVSIPLNDTQDYDLIVDNGEKLLKVQVKATGARTDCGYTTVHLASCGGTSGQVYKTIKDTNIDILFVVTELLELYEIPFKELENNVKTLNLGPDRQCFRVDNKETEYVSKQRQTQLKEEKFCSVCGKPIANRNTSGLCINCSAERQRVVTRPSKEQLLQELKESNFTQVGKKYGVSDNSIRKWCKNYNLPTTVKEIKTFVL